MVTVAAECRRAEDVTLVECRLENDQTTPVRVRLQNRLDGPTWPPRDGLYPVRGWQDDEWCGRLEAGQTVGVGFASPAAPQDEPVRVVAVGEAPDTREGRFGPDPTPDDVARTLTDPRPPRAGLFAAAEEEPTGDEQAAAEPSEAHQPTAASGLGGYLDEVTARVDRLEALAAVGTLPEATVAVADAGGLDGVRTLCARTERDRDRLLELAARAETLAGRIEAATVPVETLERLA